MTQALDVSVQAVEVTQADREAATNLIRTFWNGTGKYRDIMHMVADDMSRGETGGLWEEAFARHRIAATRTSSETTRVLVEALERMELAATAAVEAIDTYNAENGTHLCGGALFGLVKSIAPARAALSLVREGER